MLGRFAAITTTSALSATITARPSVPALTPARLTASSPFPLPLSLRPRLGARPLAWVSRRGRVVASGDMPGVATIIPQHVQRARRSEPSKMDLRRVCSDRRHVHGLGALVALLRVIGDLGPLLQRAVALAGDARVMHEQVLVAVVRGDETKTLVVAEPLYGASWHVGVPPRYVRAAARRMLLRASTCERLHCFRRFILRPDHTTVADHRDRVLSRCLRRQARRSVTTRPSATAR